MKSKPIESWSAYKRHIRGLVTAYGRQGVIVDPSSLRFLDSPFRVGGAIYTVEPGFGFRDGARLLVSEEVVIQDGEVIRPRYKYMYERAGGYTFRYEREPTDDPVWKPEFHLHVILDVPHFNACAISLEQVLGLIGANFYSRRARDVIGMKVELSV